MAVALEGVIITVRRKADKSIDAFWIFVRLQGKVFWGTYSGVEDGECTRTVCPRFCVHC